MKLCECGCGEPAPIATRTDRARGYVRGEPRRFVHGHNHRGGDNSWSQRPASTSASTGRWRAKQRVERDGCQLERIGGCQGPLHVHHRDGDPLNNDRTNLAVLCATHHGLVHAGRVTLDAAEMPAFRVDGGGKRRYG